MKKFATMAICFVLIACMVAGGSLAYLTDRDSAANVFTVGDVKIKLNEDFSQGATLMPGKDIEKKPTITNTGKNDAWVWAQIAFPALLDNEDASKNVVHFNYSKESVAEGLWTWTDTAGEWLVSDTPVDINGAKYNVYTVLYQTALKPGEVTKEPVMTKVYMDPHVDIDQDGNWFHVEKGVVTELSLNSKDAGNPVVYVSAYAIQTDGFDTVQDAYNAYTTQWTTEGGVNNGLEWATPGDVTKAATAAELQNALDNAEDGDVILLTGDITGDVTATQKADVKVTINGDGHKFAGVITVDGKSATYTTAGLTIQNVNFEADSISPKDACIRLGDGTNATRYTCNVTVKDCTFDVPDAVGVKSYTGGDKNLTISGCEITAEAHSLVQAKGIDGVLVEDCKVNSKNGLNFNNSDNVTVDGCNVDVKGYAVRFGESSGGAGAAETYLIKNCTLKSANDDGDAVIILRGTADNSTLTIENTTITGTPEITNTATGATVVK